MQDKDNDSDGSSNNGDNLSDSEVVVDFDEITYELNHELFEESDSPECVEIHLDQFTDFLVVLDAN
jgi:hypothetical protein